MAPDTTPSALSCRGLSKKFVTDEGHVRAVDAFDLEIPAGSLTALLGPSGCGKTTVLRLVAGLEHPDTGTIEVHGQTVAGATVRTPAEHRNIGMVFQDYALFPHLTVAGNVGYGLRDGTRSERKRRVAEALELVGLAAEAKRLPGALSGGQQQRVAIARALAPRPSVLLLDEPFSNLDASLRSSVRADVRRILSDAGISSLIVTHDQQEALSLADRVAVMSEGRLHQVDTPLALYRSPATDFVATFVGDADVVRAHPFDAHHVDTTLGRLETRGDATNVEHVMLRPEHLTLTHATGSENGRGQVTDLQFFGHDQLITIRLDEGTVVRARCGPHTVVQVGDRVTPIVEGSVRGFDAAGAATLRSPALASR